MIHAGKNYETASKFVKVMPSLEIEII